MAKSEDFVVVSEASILRNLGVKKPMSTIARKLPNEHTAVVMALIAHHDPLLGQSAEKH